MTKVGDLADCSLHFKEQLDTCVYWIPISGNSHLASTLHSNRMLELMQTVLSLAQSIRSGVMPLQVYIIILTALRSICLPPSVPSALWLSITPVFSSLLGFCLVEPTLSFSCATCHSSFPYQCQAVRGGGSRRQLLCCSAQPCVCNHSGCCSADWCSCVGPCCRWVISRSLGYTSLPLINCPINPAAEWIMHS